MKSNPLVTFVATAHNEYEWHRSFIESMRAQTCQDFWAEIIHNGPMDNSWHTIGNIEVSDTETNTGMWGTVNRQQAIMECDTEYIIQTSVQDYWLPQAVEYIIQGLERKPDILLWNSINHLVGPCQVLDSQLAWSKVDWGNFAIRTEIAQKVGINHGDKYTADWLFIQDVLNSGLIDNTKILKINAILTIHN